MKKLAMMLLAGALLILTAGPLFATPTINPPFTQCPKVGSALSCSYLFVVNPGGVNALFDASVGSPDGTEDTLVGILNNSGVSISSFTITGIGIGDFDGERGTGFGDDHNSPNNFFSNISPNSVTVNFNTPLTGNGGTDYFVLEGAPNRANVSGAVAPEPATIFLVGTALGGFCLRHWLRA
ncbi:MAG TPA: PEP-CTERM sorting domain-containing protein [Candidatus Acidoferrales bacterium]|jgi:hypothetical protein|nr:PEP-CTERM sorting domain-containing protein [Candidatus Acidoferrales bacterium]